MSESEGFTYCECVKKYAAFGPKANCPKCSGTGFRPVEMGEVLTIPITTADGIVDKQTKPMTREQVREKKIARAMDHFNEQVVQMQSIANGLYSEFAMPKFSDEDFRREHKTNLSQLFHIYMDNVKTAFIDLLALKLGDD